MPMSGLVRRMRDEVKDYVEYMEHIWIGKKVRLGRRNPLFPVPLWNKWTEVSAEDYVLTNNGNEVFNSTWNPSVPKSASIWTVIDCFKKEEALAQLTFRESLRGVHVAHNRSRDEGQTEKMRELHNVCSRYHSMGNKQEYLDLVTSLR